MKYSEYVKEAQKEIRDRKKYKNRNLTLHSCKVWEDGDQINLWTYWQGYQLKDIDKMGVDILLVGLDWGNVDKPENEKVLKEIIKIRRGDKNAKYIADSPTDKRLEWLFFESFNAEIMKRNPGYRLFFTNYSLGYRIGNQSEAGDNSKSLMKLDKELFEKLVSAIKPKIIICLGKDTYEMVSDSKAESFVDQLKQGKPFKAPYYNDNSIPVYGVSHPGNWGCKNIGGEGNMLKAWKKIAKEFRDETYGEWKSC